MKNLRFSILFIVFLVSTVYLPNTSAQYEDHTQLSLPESAKARLGKGWISDVVYSPDGTRLAVASSIGIWIYDANTYAEITLLTGHTANVNSVAFSPDSKKLVSGANDNTVRLWNVETGELLHTLEEHTDVVLSVAFSPDGNTFASGDADRLIRLWDAHTNQTLHKLRRRIFYTYGSYIYSLAFSPDSKILASGVRNNTVLLWDVSTGKLLHSTERHEWGVKSVAFSSDGVTLASGDGDGYVRLWGARTGKFWQRIGGHGGGVNSVVFSPDGKILASGGNDHKIKLWDAFTGEYLRTLEGHPNGVLGISFSPDGSTIASASWDEIRFWNANTGQPLHTLEGHTRSIYSIAFSLDGSILASGYHDGAIQLWDPGSGGHIHRFEGEMRTGRTESFSKAYSIAFSSDGSTFAGVSWYNIKLWDVHTWELQHTLKGRTKVMSVSFSPDGKTLASGSADSTIRLWDVDTGEHKHTFTGHTSSVYSVLFSSDGKTLASGSPDATVLLWDLIPSDPTSVTPSTPTTPNATVNLSPSSVQSPAIGEQLTFSLNIVDGENITGYQATVTFDSTALKHVQSANGDYLPAGAFFIPPKVDGNTVQLAASSLAGESSGDGTLATITFEVIAAKASTVSLSDVLLTDSAGGTTTPEIENAEITAPPQLPEDVNNDGVVNIIDLTFVASNFGEQGENAADVNGDGVVNIIDLTSVAAAFGNTAAAPVAWNRDSEIAPTKQQVQQWLREAQKLSLTDPAFQRGILVLEQLLAVLTPKETALLPNYPNPFNPETWIPYQLAEPTDVSISIYTADGQLVRKMDLGHQPVGMYKSRSWAAHWDGKNAHGEPVASGVYFYTLTAGNFSTTRKMLIRK